MNLMNRWLFILADFPDLFIIQEFYTTIYQIITPVFIPVKILASKQYLEIYEN